nr:serine protease [Pantoea agglomerans]
MVSTSRLVNRSTCRIVCDDGRSIGTGFFFAFQKPGSSGVNCPILVTNKHVIQGASEAAIRINVSEESKGRSGSIDIKIPDAGKRFIMHPDENVDLCALSIVDILKEFDDRGVSPEIFFFVDENLQGVDKITPIEDVLMTGYPNGLWDEVNNRPITRKGITASDVNLKWNGKEEFMIDMACFGGSSGSPVFILNEGSYVVDDGIKVGTRFILLGILYAGPQLNVSGRVEIVDVPTAAVAVSNSQVMMNLGIVINAKKLKDFLPLLKPW